jgi:hypothetical protein
MELERLYFEKVAEKKSRLSLKGTLSAMCPFIDQTFIRALLLVGRR